MEIDKPYNRKHAAALLRPLLDENKYWTIDERGVWPAAVFEEYERLGLDAEYEINSWKPAFVFEDAPHAPDCADTPGLAFPFSSADLAAFMLDGVGALVAGFYGEWDAGPDVGAIDKIDRANNYARQAVRSAYDAYRTAKMAIGCPDEEHPDTDAMVRELVLEGFKSNEDAGGEKLNQMLGRLNAPCEELTGQEAAEHEAAWMDETLDAAMFFALPHVNPVQAAMLLCRLNPQNEAEKDAENCNTDCTKPEDFKRLRTLFNSVDKARPANRSLLDWMETADELKCKFHPWAWRYVKQRELYGPSEPATDTALPASVVTDSARTASALSITAAPVTDSASNVSNRDFSILATRKQLIEAFGRFTGMDASWFKNITDTPALLAARKVTGQGGRGHIAEPWFCPFEVMQWLADSKRRKGRKLSTEKAWELLEKNFPKIHSAHSVADPRASD